MRKFLLAGAVGALLVAGVSVDVAGAQVAWPQEWEGHGYGNCEAATHLAYYDPRKDGETVYNQDFPNGNNTYYVDDDPMTGFQPDGNYHPGGHASEDCQGSPAVTWSAYATVTVQGELMVPDQHVGYPMCPRDTGDHRNPSCKDTRTGVYGGFYAGTGDESNGTGYEGGVRNPFSDG